MATKTISIREEAFDRLAARKHEGESFSDVVLRMTAEGPRDFSGLVGADIAVSWGKVESARERDEADERRESLLESKNMNNQWYYS